MAIVCRKCYYVVSEEEIKEHYWGEMLNFMKIAMEFVNNIYSSFRSRIKDDSEIKQENLLLARANQYKIHCPECFQYNGWVKVASGIEHINEEEK